MSALFLSPPSFDGFDGGAGARYQTVREVTSYWYPTWLALPAALTPNSKLMDCPPHNIGKDECLRIARDYDHVIIHTSTPSLKNDSRVAEAIARSAPNAVTGMTLLRELSDGFQYREQRDGITKCTHCADCRPRNACIS